MQTSSLLLDGHDEPGSVAPRADRPDPSGGAAVPLAASTNSAQEAVGMAASAFKAWSGTSANERREILLRASTALEDRADEFHAAMAHETGATQAWVRFNLNLSRDILIAAAELPAQIVDEPIPSNRPGCTAQAVRQPAGVVFSIAPWNAPIVLGVRAIAAPLACGNTVVMKSSELCPRTHQLIVDAMIAAGVPTGALNLISSAPTDANAVVEAVIAHPAVRRVNFTGSTRVGRIIAQIAGQHLKPVLLELSGKAPMLVLDDANIEAAVAAARFGAFINQGQICISTERIVVQHAVADKFITTLRKQLEEQNALSKANRQSNVGGVVDLDSAHRLSGLIDDALAKGATLEAGGKVDGLHIEATLLSGVTPAMRIYSEEIFGPIVCVILAGGDDEAVRIANDTEYGLAAAIFSADAKRAMAIARRIESGICHINGPTVHDEAQMPFGGMKASGYGRFGGTAGISEFTELRWITVQDGSVDYPE